MCVWASKAASGLSLLLGTGLDAEGKPWRDTSNRDAEGKKKKRQPYYTIMHGVNNMATLTGGCPGKATLLKKEGIDMIHTSQ